MITSILVFLFGVITFTNADRVTDLATLLYNPIRYNTLYVQHTGNETHGELGMYKFNYAIRSDKVVMVDLMGCFALEVKPEGYVLKKADGSPRASHGFTAQNLQDAEQLVKDKMTEATIEVEALYYTPMDALHAIHAVELNLGPKGVGGDRGYFPILYATEFTDHIPPTTNFYLAGGYVLEVLFGNNFNGNYTLRRLDSGVVVTSGGDENVDVLSAASYSDDDEVEPVSDSGRKLASIPVAASIGSIGVNGAITTPDVQLPKVDLNKVRQNNFQSLIRAQRLAQNVQSDVKRVAVDAASEVADP